jgi:hypothetical protein
MVCYTFYCEFITSFHINYNGKFLKPLSWCYEPKNSPDGFIEFINRSARNYIQTVFYAKYDFKNKNIIIRCEYNFFEDYLEKSETTFLLKGYKDNTYNYMNIHGNMINYLADQEILTFIKMFDHFFLEETSVPLLECEYNLYLKHLKNYPDLLSNYKSKKHDFNINIYYNKHEEGLVIKFNFNDKKNNHKGEIEYYLFKNRLVGDDFNSLDINLDNEISKRVHEIYIDFITFVEFRLK